jgi:hypothetical protein
MTRLLHNAALAGKLYLKDSDQLQHPTAMPSPPPRRRPVSRKQLRSRRLNRRSTPGLMVLCGFLYAIAGLGVMGLAELPWLWLIALGGTLLQVIGLAGPQSLQRFRWFKANLLVLISTLGAGMLAIALAIAFNHHGTDQLDDLTIGSALFEVIILSLLAVLLAALCGLVTAALGDRLLRHMAGGPAMTRLGIICVLGLGVGGGLGLLIP